MLNVVWNTFIIVVKSYSLILMNNLLWFFDDTVSNTGAVLSITNEADKTSFKYAGSFTPSALLKLPATFPA